MYDLTWQQSAAWESSGGRDTIPPGPPDPAIERAALLLWEEHCVECAVPDCYTTCRLYVARRDQKCARFEYGIFPNRSVSGLFDFGADVQFRRWGKLEARYPGRPKLFSLDRIRSYARRARHVERLATFVADVLEPVNPKRRFNGLHTYTRGRKLSRYAVEQTNVSDLPDALFVKFYYPGSEELELQLELHQDRPVFRSVIRAEPGWNERLIPLESMTAEPDRPGRLLLALSGDRTARVVFTWLDFVKMGVPASSVAGGGPTPAAKVKCVAWDLDNTLWQGVIGDAGAEGVVPNERALRLVRELDERGILQTVTSKNTYEVAWAQIEALGLSDYFLYPAIHWGPKSESLKHIASELNINVDTFALVDDSAFERAEVAERLPQVRVYDVIELEHLLSKPEFDVPVTEAASKRRLSYLAEAQRKRISASWSGDYNDFLRSCELTMQVSHPSGADRTRCLELVQRTNQLNLTTRRYSEQDFDELMSSAAIDKFAIRCTDRFGNYGLVGFVTVDLSGDVPTVRDFVLSCRVAQKRVEESFIYWYAERMQRAGKSTLRLIFIPSSRNAPLREALRAIPFDTVAQTADGEQMDLSLAKPLPTQDVVTVEEVDLEQPVAAGA